ncbi:MAG: hypothetical protein HXY40_08825 [Chloroflexi bacterium]|nr:hypothetical protein [Chloroflexota bacterium]
MLLVMLAGGIAGLVSPVYSQAQGTPTLDAETMELLIGLERGKWGDFGQVEGNTWATLPIYAPDFMQIGFYPDGARRQNMAEAMEFFAANPPPNCPPPPLSDFLVTPLSAEAAVVSYRVSFSACYVGAEFSLWASSTWVMREDNWTTVFYQASMAEPLPPAEMGIPFAGLYLSERPGGGFDALLINPDGTWAVDSGYTNEYGSTGRFDFSDGLLTITDDERTDVPQCHGTQRSANYHYTFTGTTLVLTSIDDTCAGRLAYFADRTWEK